MNLSFIKKAYFAFAMGLITTSALATTKTAQVYETITPEEMLNIVKGFGPAKLVDNSSSIVGQIEGNVYLITFVCKETTPSKKQCSSLKISLIYDDIKADYEKVNLFNIEYRLFKAIKGEKSIYFEHDIYLNGGITRESIEDKIKLIPTFVDFTISPFFAYNK